ncbi:MAG: hypothetical protein SF187_26805 [Deltaproteobacteria bacterium]|nr:hypothetical protein [Deltaproteobacteria bacterium]
MTARHALARLVFAGALLLSHHAGAAANLIAPTALLPRGVEVAAVKYKGKTSTRLKGDGIAVIKDHKFSDGTIELDVAGTVDEKANGEARGFIGLAFRVQTEEPRYEVIYLRPTNGRADDQLRRNHATQYASYPEFPWSRLRAEAPGKYESYVDLEPGAWTHIRIVVKGKEARLFVHSSTQPALVVHDLKLPELTGAIALWIGPGTVGFFRALRISPSTK